jgi:hypothetical protein
LSLTRLARKGYWERLSAKLQPAAVELTQRVLHSASEGTKDFEAGKPCRRGKMRTAVSDMFVELRAMICGTNPVTQADASVLTLL